MEQVQRCEVRVVLVKEKKRLADRINRICFLVFFGPRCEIFLDKTISFLKNKREQMKRLFCPRTVQLPVWQKNVLFVGGNILL